VLRQQQLSAISATREEPLSSEVPLPIAGPGKPCQLSCLLPGSMHCCLDLHQSGQGESMQSAERDEEHSICRPALGQPHGCSQQPSSCCSTVPFRTGSSLPQHRSIQGPVCHSQVHLGAMCLQHESWHFLPHPAQCLARSSPHSSILNGTALEASLSLAKSLLCYGCTHSCIPTLTRAHTTSSSFFAKEIRASYWQRACHQPTHSFCSSHRRCFCVAALLLSQSATDGFLLRIMKAFKDSGSNI